MANLVTGTTDTSGALSVVPVARKCIVLVGEKKADVGETVSTVYNTILDISGTADVITKFGSLSPLVAIAKNLISNGVSYIKGIMVGEYGDGKTYADVASAYEAAFAKLLLDNTVKVIITDNNASTIITKLKTHLTQAESEDMYRYGVVGDIVAQTNAQLATFAEAINDKRIFMSGPNVLSEAGVALDGIYGAAGLASAIMTETADPALPLNGVQIVGFGGTERVLLKADKDTLVAAGVTPLYTSPAGYPTIHRLVTTYTKNGNGDADPTWNEGTTVFIADDVLETVINTLKANFPRTKNVARILDAIRTKVIGVLQYKQGLEIIQNFDPTTVVVIKDPSDVYGALVSYEFQVVTPLYTITIVQSMKF